MDADGQARVGRVGRSVGVPNYRNDILINVVEEYLPQGLEAWREVAMAKPEEVVADALGASPTTKTTSSSRLSSCISPQKKPKMFAGRRWVVDCRNSIFSCFLPFSAKKVVPDSRFSDARFFQGRLFNFLQKIWNGWPANHSRFFGLLDPDFQISRFLSNLF